MLYISVMSLFMCKSS